MYKLLLIQTVS